MRTPLARWSSRRWQSFEHRFWAMFGGWPSFFIPAALALLAVTSGACGEDEPQAQTASALWIAGHAHIGNGTVLPDEDADYKLRIRMQVDGKDCEFATGMKSVSFDPDGGYSLVVNAADLHSPTAGCAATRFSTDELVSVDLDARLAPTSELCTDFCEASSDTQCGSDCTGEDAHLGATHTFGTQELEQAKSNEANTIALRANLEFNTILGPFPTDGPNTGDEHDHDGHDPEGHDHGDEGESPVPSGPPNPGLPDFTVDAESTQATLRFERQSFSASSCAIVEGCLTGTGERTLLKFDAVLVNEGVGDFVLGAPAESDEFGYSSCHGHYHLNSIAEYRLVTGTGEAVVTSRKQGFCMMDSLRASGSEPARYNCSYQGLTAGWADVYDSSLDCQWLDVTGIAKGDYTLEVEVNPGGEYEEASRENNTISVEVTIP